MTTTNLIEILFFDMNTTYFFSEIRLGNVLDFLWFYTVVVVVVVVDKVRLVWVRSD